MVAELDYILILGNEFAPGRGGNETTVAHSVFNWCQWPVVFFRYLQETLVKFLIELFGNLLDRLLDPLLSVEGEAHLFVFFDYLETISGDLQNCATLPNTGR